MNIIKIKHNFLILFSSIVFTMPLLNGMPSKAINFKECYSSESKTLNLTNLGITPAFLNDNQQSLRDFIVKNSVQKLALQRNGLQHIPVSILGILLEKESPLKEINIVFPLESIAYKGLNLTILNQAAINKIQEIPDGVLVDISEITISGEKGPSLLEFKVTKKEER